MEPKKLGRPPKADAKRARIDLRMEPADLDRLKDEAKRRGTTPADLARTILRDALK